MIAVNEFESDSNFIQKYIILMFFRRNIFCIKMSENFERELTSKGPQCPFLLRSNCALK